jgi:pimeloyl-ACP methyl ester carboxylesterase
MKVSITATAGGLIDRRTFATLVVAAAASPFLQRVAGAQSVPKARNVVLVHGLFADGSCWSEVIARLQAKGLQAIAVQNPLTTLQAAVEATRRVLAWQQGLTVLVAHSFGGMILTEAGVDPKVSALVYVAARAPDAGEDYTALASGFPTPPASAGIFWSDDEGRLSEEAFLRDFAGDLPADKARVLYAVQARSNERCWPTRRPTRHGDRSRAGTRCPRKTGRSIRTLSALWPSAWARKRSS